MYFPHHSTGLKSPQRITTAKLMIAIGLASSPRPIFLPRKDELQRTLFTFGSIRHAAAALLASRNDHVAVHGGSQAAMIASMSSPTPESASHGSFRPLATDRCIAHLHTFILAPCEGGLEI